ncbi:unnamed protein product [Polarella glacialis]|uniref:Uncharacterized protein n=1 Tax=Polarella glacialis TaxID=89957 RepID=A0A813K6I6_POLGL|nr:unnamed protein product [Polarella glacialis]
MPLPPCRYSSYGDSREESHRIPCLPSAEQLLGAASPKLQGDACSWAVAPCLVRTNINGRGTVSEQRMLKVKAWNQAHAQGQGQGREFQTVPLAVPSAHHRMQPSEAFRITVSQETAASRVAGKTGTTPRCVASTAAAAAARAVAVRTLSCDATAAYLKDGAFFGGGSFAAKSLPFPSRTPLCTALPLAFLHLAAPWAWQQLPIVRPQPKPEQQLGQGEPEREEESRQSTPLLVEKQDALRQYRAIQLGQQLYRELFSKHEVLDQIDEPLGMGARELHSLRPPPRQSADRTQLPGSVEEPGGDEDLTTPIILGSAGFHLEH